MRDVVQRFSALEPSDAERLEHVRAEVLALLQPGEASERMSPLFAEMMKACEELRLLSLADLQDPGEKPVYEPPDLERPRTPKQQADDEKALAGGDAMTEYLFAGDPETRKRQYQRELQEYRASYRQAEAEARRDHAQRLEAWKERKRIYDIWKSGETEKAQTRAQLRTKWQSQREKIVRFLRTWAMPAEPSRGLISERRMSH